MGICVCNTYWHFWQILGLIIVTCTSAGAPVLGPQAALDTHYLQHLLGPSTSFPAVFSTSSVHSDHSAFCYKNRSISSLNSPGFIDCTSVPWVFLCLHTCGLLRHSAEASASLFLFGTVCNINCSSTRCFFKLLGFRFSYSISLAHLQLWNKNWRLPEASSLWTSAANCISLIYSVWDNFFFFKKSPVLKKNFQLHLICHVLRHIFSKKTNSLISSLFTSFSLVFENSSDHQGTENFP